MKKTLLASLFTMTLVSQAEAGCLTLTNQYSGAIPPDSTVTAYGPVTLVNGPGCRSIIIAARVQPLGSGAAPEMWIEKQEEGQWRKVAEAPGTYASVVTTPGTFRIRHFNKHPILRAYSGSITTTR
jgi:hypothetical protein